MLILKSFLYYHNGGKFPLLHFTLIFFISFLFFPYIFYI